MKKRTSVLIVPGLVALASLILVFVAIFNFWFGTPKGGIMLFCEQARLGFIKQPSNTYSNIGFVIAGLYIAWLAFQNRFDRSNRMTETLFYPSFFASIVVFLGPGSMALHATNTAWGGFMDLFSMFLFSSFVFCYGLMRWFRLSETTFAMLYFANVAFCSWVHLSPYNEAFPPLLASEICFGAHLFFGMILEICHRYIRKVPIEANWGWACVFTFGVAFFIWNISRTQESWFCDPDSLMQGHAMWHLLNALAIYFLYIFYASEGKKRKLVAN